MARHHVYGPRYKRLIELLAQARKQSGINQTELALRLGVDQGHVSKIERRERRLDVIEYFEFCREIGADPFALYMEAAKVPITSVR